MRWQWHCWSLIVYGQWRAVNTQNPFVDEESTTPAPSTSASTSQPRSQTLPGSWDYRDQAAWPSSFPTCGDSGVQSPLDVSSWQTTSSGTLRLNPPQTDKISATLETNTWTRVVHWGTLTSEEASITWNGEDYFLRNFSYRSPSENTVQARFADMEVQYQHQSIHGDGLVLAVRMMCSHGADRNDFMHRFWNRFPDTADQTSSADIGNPYAQGSNQALPSDLSFFRWTGTWSNPPCTPNTIWILFHATVTCSAEQMRSFREQINQIRDNKLVSRSPPYGVSSNWDAALRCNNRDRQAVGTRTVFYHQQAGSGGSSDDDDDDDDDGSRRRFWYQRWWFWILMCICYCCCSGGIAGLAYSFGDDDKKGSAKGEDLELEEERQPLQPQDGDKPPKVLDMDYDEEDDGAPYHVAKPKHHRHHSQSHGQHTVQTIGDYTFVPAYGDDASRSYQQQASFALPPSSALLAPSSGGGVLAPGASMNLPPQSFVHLPPSSNSIISSGGMASRPAPAGQPRLPPTAGHASR